MTDKPARSRPKTPKASGTPGERLKAAILERYELSAAEATTLDQASALLDQLRRINVALAKQPVTTTGSRGQVVGNPLLDEQRRHADTVARLLDALHIPTDDQQEGETVRTMRARAAAEARWKGAS